MNRDEKRLLGCILHSPPVLVELGWEVGLSGEHFEGEARLLYDEISRLYRDSGSVPPVALLDAVKDRLPEAARVIGDCLAAVSGPVGARHYAQHLVRAGRARRLREIGQRLAACAPENAEEVGGAALLEVAQLLTSRRREVRHIGEVVAEQVEELTHRRRDPKRAAGIPTGIAGLDRLLCGLERGQLHIVAGRPSMGKSTLLLNIARHVSAAVTTLLFSLETEAARLATEIAAGFARVSQRAYDRPADVGEATFSQMVDGMWRAQDCDLWIDDGARRLADIIARSRLMAARYKVSVVIVDYLQLVAIGRRVESRRLEVGEISRALKALAGDLNVAVVAASQLNRAPDQRDDHRPRLSDLRESGDIEQDADVVMLLYRPAYYAKKRNGQLWLGGEVVSEHVAELGVAKNRHGETGGVRLYYDAPTFTFADYVEEAQ